jgi:tetratricopeptide repeat protein 30
MKFFSNNWSFLFFFSSQELRESNDTKALQRAIDGVEASLEQFLPPLMGQAKLLWEKSQWPQIERLFRLSAEFCRGNDVWKLNLAHTLFMQEKFTEARWGFLSLFKFFKIYF